MSSISSIGSSNAMMMQGMRGLKRPDPAEMANNLFARLDTSSQGYLTKTDLQAAFDKVASTSSTSSSSSSVDDLFSQLDTDSDGKVTQQEFSDTLQQLAEELDNQAMSMRMSGAMQGMGGMPPPPPPEDDSGFTKDELSGQLSEIGTTDSQRSTLISNIVDNFDAADTDGNGKVSFQEAMAYQQETSSSSSASQASAATRNLDSQVMMQIMRLMQAYDIGGEQSDARLMSTLSVTA